MLEELSREVSDCLVRAAQARCNADQTTDPRTKADLLIQERNWNRLAQSYAFAESVDRFLCGSSEAADGWQPARSAPFDRDLQLAVIDQDGTHELVFPCHRRADGWMESRTGRPIDIAPTHWREWMDVGRGPADKGVRNDDGVRVFEKGRARVSVARGDANSFELVIRAHGEEITIYDVEIECLANMGRRLLAIAARA